MPVNHCGEPTSPVSRQAPHRPTPLPSLLARQLALRGATNIATEATRSFLPTDSLKLGEKARETASSRRVEIKRKGTGVVEE